MGKYKVTNIYIKKLKRVNVLLASLTFEIPSLEMKIQIYVYIEKIVHC